MTTNNEQPITQSVTLTLDHINASAVIVEQGIDDRSNYLQKFSAEENYTDKDIATAHYEMDCASEAVEKLKEAFGLADHPQSDHPAQEL